MKQIWKFVARVLFYAVSVGLFVYAASRSLDFITATLPADQQILGYLGLLATGGGAVAWLVVFLHYAQGTAQKGLSILLVVIDLLGEFALFTFDTIYRSGEAGMIAQLAPDEIRMVVLGLSALIAINIGASFAFHLVDLETSKRMKEESAKDVLDTAVLNEIEKKAPQLAERMTPQIVQEWEQDFASRFGDMSSLGLGRVGRRKYYYRKRREGRRVVSEYVGAGIGAEALATMDKVNQEEQRAARQRRQREQFQYMKEEREAIEVIELTRLLTRAALLLSGYHPHKGQWRKRQDDKKC